MSADAAAAAAGVEVVPLARRARGHRLPRRATDPARFAAGQHRLFTGHNLLTSPQSVVHAVAWRAWLDELELPAPACRQGWSGLGAGGDLLPTRWPVTCRRCRRLRGEHLPADGDAPVQEALF